MTTASLNRLLERMLAGDARALARLMTLVESEGPELGPTLQAIAPRLGHALTIGITGPPGAGKSSLVDRLVPLIRKAGKTVGIIAIDPSSPFTGGALLGDRIRMTRHFLDEGVFIRSMATRGSRGGLSRATRDVIKLLDAAGRDHVLVETVGVGQIELDVMGATDTVVVALVPEAGDGVQAMKAGLMEIADIFVVNKADRDGASRMQAELTSMLELKYAANHPEPGDPPSWKVPVLAAQALHDVGMPELFQAIEDHQRFLRDSGELARRRKTRRREEVLARVEVEARRRLTDRAQTDAALAELLDEVGEGRRDAYSASLEILAIGIPGVKRET